MMNTCLLPICGRLVRFSALSTLFFGSQVFAAEPVIANAATPSSFITVLQVFFSLGLVLALIALVAWMMKRINTGHQSASSSLRVVSAVAVGPRERVVLVDVGDVRLVLGVANGQVTALHQMPRPEFSDEGNAALPTSFTDKLKQILEKKV